MMMKQMPGQIQQAHLQLGSNQMLQQVVSGQLLGIGQGAATSFLNKLGLQPGQATGSNASLQKVCFRFVFCNSVCIMRLYN